MDTEDSYVRLRDGIWYVGDSRVPLYSVIAMWQQGYSPEEIQASFPHIGLQAVYGAILRYLEHRDELDRFFREQDALYQEQKAAAEAANPEFYGEMHERIARYRAEQHAQPPAAS